MTNIRLLPVVVVSISALLLLKTVGLVTDGSYVLAGVGVARAAGASSDSGAGTSETDATTTLAAEPTIEDTSPTLADDAPTLGGTPEEAATEAAENGDAPAGDVAPQSAAAAPGVALGANCVEADASITASGEVILRAASGEAAEGGADAEPEAEAQAVVVPEGSFAAQMAVDCLPSGDAVPMEISDEGEFIPLAGADGASPTEQQLLQRLTARRAELQQYETDLALRASIVDAAEKRIEERAATLEALEAQISTLVDQRQEMEAGQFASIVAMYEAMKPKDAAKIFDNLDMNVLLRVAKTMTPRKMAPVLAEMNPTRAQELTVEMAAIADQPATEITPEGLASLPQIVGQ